MSAPGSFEAPEVDPQAGLGGERVRPAPVTAVPGPGTPPTVPRTAERAWAQEDELTWEPEGGHDWLPEVELPGWEPEFELAEWDPDAEVPWSGPEQEPVTAAPAPEPWSDGPDGDGPEDVGDEAEPAPSASPVLPPVLSPVPTSTPLPGADVGWPPAGVAPEPYRPAAPQVLPASGNGPRLPVFGPAADPAEFPDHAREDDRGAPDAYVVSPAVSPGGFRGAVVDPGRVLAHDALPGSYDGGGVLVASSRVLGEDGPLPGQATAPAAPGGRVVGFPRGQRPGPRPRP